MPIRRYPGRPNPFVEQKSKIDSKGMGIGAIVFVMVLFGILLAVLYLLPPLMETVVFPDIGIPYSTLFLVILGCLVLVSIILMYRKGMYVASGTGYKDRDPAICQRVVKDGYDGPEVIISGPREATFAQVCRENWLFKNVDQKSRWFIRDAQGNDVTDRILETFDGIFILVSEYNSDSQKELQKEEPDESDEYSSLHDSVTYYD